MYDIKKKTWHLDEFNCYTANQFGYFFKLDKKIFYIIRLINGM